MRSACHGKGDQNANGMCFDINCSHLAVKQTFRNLLIQSFNPSEQGPRVKNSCKYTINANFSTNEAKFTPHIHWLFQLVSVCSHAHTPRFPSWSSLLTSPLRTVPSRKPSLQCPPELGCFLTQGTKAKCFVSGRLSRQQQPWLSPCSLH